MRSPFEPLGSCALFHLSIKIIAAICISKLYALVADPLFTVFQKDKNHSSYSPNISTKGGLKFSHKTVYNFTSAFPPKLHVQKGKLNYMLHIRRALAFYLDRTKPFRQAPSSLLKSEIRVKLFLYKHFQVGLEFVLMKLMNWRVYLFPREIEHILLDPR